MSRDVHCPYCHQLTVLVDGLEIYPHRPDLSNKFFYLCSPCDAYVGCHPGTTNPLGRPANAELRRAKSAAHRAFDPLWQSGQMTRSGAYSWLATQLGIKKSCCHIGMFSLSECQRTVELCEALEE